MDISKKPFYLTESESHQVQVWLSSLSLEQKVGQLFCILGDLYTEDKLLDLIKTKGIGGVLLRPDTKEHIIAKYKKIDALATIPLFKAANLEDGASGALSDGTRYSSEMGIAATGDPEFARSLALSSSYEARQAGINITFSPDSDIDFNFLNPITNERTYGNNPSVVANFVSTELKGFLDNGLLPCVKHFPGDGIDFRDQHLLTTYNTLPYDQWMASYGMVYRKAIETGTPCFMVGHIAAPHLERHLNPKIPSEEIRPASLSKGLLQGILRKELGFEGLILSDATIMGGFTQAYARKDALPLAINSGIDMLVFNADIDEDYDYMLEAAKNGTLSTERLNEALTRIFAAKLLARRLSLIRPTNVTDENKRDVADKAITLVKNKDHVLPLTHEKYDGVEIISLGNDLCPAGSIKALVAKRLKQEGYKVSFFSIDKVEMHGPGKLNPRILTLYLANLETASNQTTVRIDWAKKHALDSPRYVHEIPYAFVSFANPYHLIDAPRVQAYINAYTANDRTIEAVINKLLGLSPFVGRSPVDPFCYLEDTHL
jgi:beta-N-acetylhexosaminidase